MISSLKGVLDIIELFRNSDDVIRYYVIDNVVLTYTSRSIPLLSFSLDVDLLDEYSIKISVTSLVFSEKIFSLKIYFQRNRTCLFSFRPLLPCSPVHFLVRTPFCFHSIRRILEFNTIDPVKNTIFILNGLT